MGPGTREQQGRNAEVVRYTWRARGGAWSNNRRTTAAGAAEDAEAFVGVGNFELGRVAQGGRRVVRLRPETLDAAVRKGRV